MLDDKVLTIVSEGLITNNLLQTDGFHYKTACLCIIEREGKISGRKPAIQFDLKAVTLLVSTLL